MIHNNHNNSVLEDPLLSQEEKERTKRQKLIEGWNQPILKQSTVFIAGIGALGCEIAKDLALIGVGKLILCDLDKVETSNLSRQMLFYRGDEGGYKAEVAAIRLKLMNPFMEIETYTIPLQKIPMDVYRKCQVVIAALDSVQARMDLNKFCLKLGIPMVEGGTIGLEGHVQVVIPETTKTKLNQPFPIGNRGQIIEQLVEEKFQEMQEADYPDYTVAMQKVEHIQDQIELLEAQISQIKNEAITPLYSQFKTEILNSIKENPTDYMHHTACYRCLVPIPPSLRNQVAACTLKGIPRNREHCAIRGEVHFNNEFERNPDYKNQEDMEKTMQFAQEELRALRERVLTENIPPEQKDSFPPAELMILKENIFTTFGKDFELEDMENILGNKVPAIQSVSSIISSIQSQEVLKILYLMAGESIGPVMSPPYLNYNGKYGLFDPIPVFRSSDCVACGSRQGIDIFKVALPEEATVDDLFMAMRQVHPDITKEHWMITNPLSKEFIYTPLFEKGQTGASSLISFNLHNLSEVTLTVLGEFKEKSDIKQYNVIIEMF
jgi:molybdopterin/thiamine biosynthesis adenylyltransferase